MQERICDEFTQLKAQNVALSHVPGLDGLRGIAVLLVIFFHSGYLKFGWIGVQLFFVLSGYLISSILIESRRNKLSYYLKKFYWRRVLRIFPLYYASLLILTVLFLVTGFPAQFGVEWPYLYSYTFNFSPLTEHFHLSHVFDHFWSLSVEEQFYFVWPFLIFLVPPRRMAWLSVGLIALIPVMCYFVGEWFIAHGRSSEYVGDLAYYLMIFQAGGFASGAYAALVHRGYAKSYFPRWYLAAGAVLLFGILNVWWSKFPGGDNMSWSSLGFPRPSINTAHGQHIWGYVIINLLSVTVIHAVIMKDRFLHFLDSKPLVEVGKLSYGVYVYHLPIWKLLKASVSFTPYTLKGIASFALYVVIVMAVSAASYYLFEQRFLKLKDKLFTKPPVAVPA
ncbi:MAG: acyltransferase [bacterium]|nr:acyltransferase [bacterium]